MTVTVIINRATQTITGFNLASPVSLAIGDTFTLSAMGGASGNPVTFASGTPSVCTTSGITGATVTVVAAGTCTVTANQAGNVNHSAALTVSANVVIAVQAALQVFYIHPDHLGTPRAITKASDNSKVWEWKNDDAFGNNPPDENPSGLAAAFQYNLRFPGQYFDQETGTMYNYFRDYDPATGRYVQSDPIGLRGGINTYAYVDGMPLTLSDPKGLWFGFDCYECFEKLKIYNKILSDCRKLYDRYCYNQDGSRDEQRTNNFLQLYGGGSDSGAIFNCAQQGALSALGTNVLGDISSCQKCAWGPKPGRKLPPK